MTRTEFQRLDTYMRQCMQDSAHDREHVYRVLYTALDIASSEADADLDLLITACLLHDIGRQKQIEDPTVCHALAGAEMAAEILSQWGYDAHFCTEVADCIRTHRFRKNRPPQSPEAKILFDADKLDVTGAMGAARTLLYAGRLGGPLYTLQNDGSVSDGSEDTIPSFFQEYHRKLKRLYDRFYTEKGAQLAALRRQAAENFYHALLQETRDSYRYKNLLTDILE